MGHVRSADVLVVILVYVSAASGQRCDPACRLPHCSCPRYQYPMNVKEIPQMVYFGFDDSVNVLMAKFYNEIFTPRRLNPNKCPISMTLFVSHRYTDYRFVRQFYERGMEIAVHSVTHTRITNASHLAEEATQQRQNIVKLAGVPFSEVVGWRSPFLLTAGDAQPVVLNALNFEYDISLTYSGSRAPIHKPWPFTMDNGWPYMPCDIRPCPYKARVPGFWEVPVDALLDYNGTYLCAYVDGCMDRPTTAQEAFDFLWNNFMGSYTGTRVPLGLNMHGAWFLEDHNLQGTLMFLDKLATFDDVYVLSVKKVLDWMKNPTPLSKINTLESWSC